MMTKADILNEIGLEELSGTEFENLMVMKKFKEATSVCFKKTGKFDTYFIVEGKTRHIINTPEGGRYNRDFSKGDIPGLNFSISNKKSSEGFRIFDIDTIFTEGTIIVYLPFEKIIDLELKNKEVILEKIIMLGIEDHFKEFNYLLSKTIYSDQDFFIKYLEKQKTSDIGSSKEISECLNINIRTLQRLLKKLSEEGIIERSKTNILIKDKIKLENYKKKLKEKM